jgi:hypothetical protein
VLTRLEFDLDGECFHFVFVAYSFQIVKIFSKKIKDFSILCVSIDMSVKKNTEDFIKDANVVHGNLYDYSKTDYTLARNKVVIICKTHGEFTQEANSHLMGHGCKSCQADNRKVPDDLKWNKKSYMKEYSKKYRRENKERLKEKANQRIDVIRKSRIRFHNKNKNDISYKIRRNLSKRLWKCLKFINSKPKTLKLLGCDIDTLKNHLQLKFIQGMTWDNYGEWHIDHIKPCASFDLINPDQQKVCFHYTNLQPLWASDNCSKGARLL